MKYSLPTLFICLILTGCGSHTTNFVVYRNVPENPSFIVLPSYNTEREIAFANQIEHMLISCHVSVHLRPRTKYIENERGARDTQKEIGEKSTEKSSVTEWYFALEDFTADYIVQTYERTYVVKISKRETNEILAVLQLPVAQDQFTFLKQTPRVVIFEALVNLL
ncbi:hypothetical protein C6501_00365 [Candidatus Poribacteria bacterium]|nr:MAG: hypothetical protein C6501_00365 [Candidatus Poribacteria bacterium]